VCVKNLKNLNILAIINSIKDILQPGNKLVAAGYCMYGSSTQLVLSWGNGVHGFTLDPTIGAFILSHHNIRIPDTPKTVRTDLSIGLRHSNHSIQIFV
jgi:fructose-1,6-bisphosphatase I